jgi:hypothetical protein
MDKTNKNPRKFQNLSDKEKKDLLVRAAKSANEQQRKLEEEYLTLQDKTA